MTTSLPTFTSLMDQARAAVAELDQALVDIDAKIDAALLDVDRLRAERRNLVEQRRPIAAILPGGRSAAPGRTKPYVAPEKQPCPHCGKKLKHVALHIASGKCPSAPATAVAAPPPAPAVEPPLVEQLAAVALAEFALDRDLTALFTKHHRESFARRCEIAADALGKTTAQIRARAQRLGLS